MIQSRTKNRRGLAVVFRSAKDCDRIGGLRLIHPCEALNLRVDPGAPSQAANQTNYSRNSNRAEDESVRLRYGSSRHAV
jgi:hypothetical protein